jgi:hypothetical protein
MLPAAPGGSPPRGGRGVVEHPADPYAKRLMDDVPKLRAGPQGREGRG